MMMMINLNLSSSGFCRSNGTYSKKKRNQKDKQISGSGQKAEKTVENDGDTSRRALVKMSEQEISGRIVTTPKIALLKSAKMTEGKRQGYL